MRIPFFIIFGGQSNTEKLITELHYLRETKSSTKDEFKFHWFDAGIRL